MDRCSCLYLYGLFSHSQQCNRGCLQTPACPLSPLWEQWGGWGWFLNESRHWRVVPQHLLRRGNVQKVGGAGAAGRGYRSGRGVERLRLGEEWLCRLLVHWSCCCSLGCVSFRHSPASPRHEPRRKGVLLHAQLLCKSTSFYLGVRFCLSLVCDGCLLMPSPP